MSELYSLRPATPTTEQRLALQAIVDALWADATALMATIMGEDDPTPTFIIVKASGQRMAFGMPFGPDTKHAYMELARDELASVSEPVVAAALLCAMYMRKATLDAKGGAGSLEEKTEGLRLHVETPDNCVAAVLAPILRSRGKPASLGEPIVNFLDASAELKGAMIGFFRDRANKERIQ